MTTGLLTATNGTQAAHPRHSLDRGTDAADLQRIAAGDSGGMADIYDRHSAVVFGLALRIANDRAIAEDIVQETFVSVWRCASGFDPAKASARTWILTIAHHRAVDAVRRRRRPVISLNGDEDGAPVWGPDVWPEVSARLDGAAVRLALAELPHAQRRTVELAYFGGMTQQEIAETTGAPLGTVKSRVRLGLSGLRKSLSPAYIEPKVIGTAS